VAGHRWRIVTAGLRVVPRAAFIAGQLPVFATTGCARHNSAVRRRTSVDALGSGTRDGPRGTWGGYGAVEDVARVPRVPTRRELVARASRRWEPGQHGRRGGAVRSAAKPAGRPARRRRSRARPIRFQPVNPTLTARIFKNLNCATKTVDTKVVVEISLYNICEGHPMFFSMV
jgi:hypothetical protein